MKILFKQPYCVCCGLTGRYWALEREKDDSTNPNKPYHFNLYAIEPKYGLEIKLTHDHIKPQSKGGDMSLENAQTLCELCNNSKGNMEDMPMEVLKKLNGLLVETFYLRSLPRSKKNNLKCSLYTLQRKRLAYPYAKEHDKSLIKIYLDIIRVKFKLLFCV